MRFVARSADGTEVPCWAVAPVGAEKGKRYPTILNVHGGPFTSYGNRFFDEFQLQAGSGFGVLFCNPRGSSGYTEAWGRAVRWPECDERSGLGLGRGRLRRRHGLCRRGLQTVRLGRLGPIGDNRWVLRRIHDLVGYRSYEPVQGCTLRKGL